MQYWLLKALHIVSVVVFLGNIITGVFWKLHADRTGDLRARAQALDGLIKADRIFTSPAAVLILVTGLTLAVTMHLPIFGTKWILWALVLFGLAGAMFGVFVGPLQKKLLANVRAGLSGSWDEAEYHALSRAWFRWGVAATVAPLAALFLMVFKPT
jgi:uncharacterized membrane protein